MSSFKDTCVLFTHYARLCSNEHVQKLPSNLIIPFYFSWNCTKNTLGFKWSLLTTLLKLCRTN